MSEKRPDDLERLLDRTLRGLVAGEGPDDLRLRVLSRLPGPRPRAFSPAWATAALVAAAATGWWLWPSAAPVSERVGKATIEAPTRLIPQASRSPSPHPAVSTGERLAATPRWSPATEAADPPIPPLPPPDLLAMASLEPADIEIEPLAFAPLVVADLTVEPLAEPEHERKD